MDRKNIRRIAALLAASLLMSAASCGNVIEKSGSWFSYKGEKLGQGQENVKLLLKQNTALKEELEKQIREFYSIDDVKES